ncbi:hypothetical protein EVA_19198 [gut metagenome]|uniref:Uncharacterized protein n=1 Tax=gut metagenome TaxID=749906 RepID=J9FCS2_9ZZZZ
MSFLILVTVFSLINWFSRQLLKLLPGKVVTFPKWLLNI